jgi:hypothetical protein
MREREGRRKGEIWGDGMGPREREGEGWAHSSCHSRSTRYSGGAPCRWVACWLRERLQPSLGGSERAVQLDPVGPFIQPCVWHDGSAVSLTSSVASLWGRDASPA